MRRIEARPGAATPPPDQARLCAALEQRTAEWKRDLRAEPTLARRLLGPLELHDDATRPEWVPFEASVMPGALLYGLVLQLVASPKGVPPFRAPGVLWGRVGWAA